jgi:hypothetical protein
MRLVADSRCYCSQHILTRRTVSRISYFKMYGTVLKPFGRYRCETWPMSQQDKFVFKAESKVVPVLNKLSTMARRCIG